MIKQLSILLLATVFLAPSFSQTESSPPVRKGTPGIPALSDKRKAAKAVSDIQITSLEENISPEDMIYSILGTGINISGISYTGSNQASGIFTNGKSTGIDFESGIILSSGWAHSILGPNNSINTSNNNIQPGDTDLSSIIGEDTYDAAVLEFDFIPQTEVLTFDYVLFSEEYPEYLDFTDVFAFILDGENIALVPGTTQPVAIGTVNHKTNSNYYLSNEEGNYNLQPDGFTTVLTASAIVTKGVKHHIKLAIADMGDAIYDSWVLVAGNSFSSLGTIKGTVYDSQSMQPIFDAQVSASGNNQAQTRTDEDGGYIILNLEFGYGYEMTLVAPGYQKKEIDDINILQEHPLVIQDIYMDPISGDFVVESVKPDPNPAISKVMPNHKTIHRYYYVRNLDDDSPGVGIPVYVSYPGGEDIYYSNDRGIVDIAISELVLPDNIGDHMDFEIYRVLNKNLGSPVKFSVEIVDAQLTKYWVESNNIDGNFSHLVGGLESNSITSLSEYEGGITTPEKLLMTSGDNGYLGLGIPGLSVGGEALIKVNNFKVGASAMAGVKVDGKLSNETEYEFDYFSDEEKEDIAKYYLYFKSNFGLLDNSLIRLGSIVEEYLINNHLLGEYFQSEKRGFTLKGSGSANADLGLVLPMPFNLSVGAELDASAEIGTGIIADKELNENRYFGISVEGSGSASTNMLVTLPKSEFTQNVEERLSFFDHSIEGTYRRGVSLTICGDRVELGFVKRNVTQTGWETIDKYIITGEDVLYYFSSVDLLKGLIDAFEGKEVIDIVIESQTYGGMIKQIFEVLSSLGKELASGKLMISYESYRSDFTEDVPLDLYIGLGGALGIELHASLGGGKTIEVGKTKMVTEGKWLNFRHLPIYEYNTFIPDIPLEQEEVIQDIIDGIPLYLRLLIGTYQVVDFINPLKSASEETRVDLGEGGSYLLIDPAVVPAGSGDISCVSWGWYGDASTMKSAVYKSASFDWLQYTKKSAQELYKLEYGIGGFYRLEPSELDLNGEATLVIKYADEEVDGLNESALGIYYEDPDNHKWVYVGGTVDQESNEVSANISKLALYTAAPAVPDGDLVLTASHNSIQADGISLTSITSQAIQYNNLQTVSNNELFTVSATNGTILNADQDPESEGIQIRASSGILSIDLQSSLLGIESEVRVVSFRGDASGSIVIDFVDEIAPPSPKLLLAEGFNNAILVRWDHVDDIGLAGYKVYFDSDSQPPYDGIAKINGNPSPIFIGKDSSFVITELFEDSTYFVTVTAIDVSDNESAFSNVISTSMELNHKPVIESQVFDVNALCNNETVIGMLSASDQDNDQLVYSIVGGKNSDMFEIDPESGLIYLRTGSADYDDSQNLLIKVTDDGPGELSSTTIVTMNTNCQMNHYPQLEEALFEVMEEDMVPNYVLGRIQAWDQDEGQAISYEFLSPKLETVFTLNRETGELFVSDSDVIEFAESGEIRFKVVATDNGEGWLSDTAEVIITLFLTHNQTRQSDLLFNIYPNPTTGKVRITPRELLKESVRIEIYSVIGTELFETIYPENYSDDMVLNLESFDPGVYIIRLTHSGKAVIAYVVRQ